MCKIIRISPSISLNSLMEFSAEWDRHDDVDLIIEEMSGEDMERIVNLLLPLIPSDFYESVLEALSERPAMPSRLLCELFDKGGIACQMSICMRDDLDGAIKEKCANSQHPEVRKHFELRQDWLQNQK